MFWKRNVLNYTVQNISFRFKNHASGIFSFQIALKCCILGKTIFSEKRKRLVIAYHQIFDNSAEQSRDDSFLVNSFSSAILRPFLIFFEESLNLFFASFVSCTIYVFLCNTCFAPSSQYTCFTTTAFVKGICTSNSFFNVLL